MSQNNDNLKKFLGQSARAKRLLRGIWFQTQQFLFQYLEIASILFEFIQFHREGFHYLKERNQWDTLFIQYFPLCSLQTLGDQIIGSTHLGENLSEILTWWNEWTLGEIEKILVKSKISWWNGLTLGAAHPFLSILPPTKDDSGKLP